MIASMRRTTYRLWAMGAALVLACAISATMAIAATTAKSGDTLDYDGTVLHLWGIEAPDKEQTCSDGWPAGKMAADHLAKLIDGQKVEGELKSAANASPAYAVCKVGQQDLGAAMVRAGMAWTNLQQSAEYSIGETNAMVEVVGVHAHRCLEARQWRARHGR